MRRAEGHIIFSSAPVVTNWFNDVAIITRRKIISTRWSNGWRSGRPRNVAICLIAIIWSRSRVRTFRATPVNTSKHVVLSVLTASILTCIWQLENHSVHGGSRVHSAAESQDDDIQGNLCTPK